MPIEKKIQQLVRDFCERKDKYLAAKLANLYLALSRRTVEKEVAVAACIEGLYCLKAVGCDVSINVLDLRLRVSQKDLGSWLQVVSKKSYCR